MPAEKAAERPGDRTGDADADGEAARERGGEAEEEEESSQEGGARDIGGGMSWGMGCVGEGVCGGRSGAGKEVKVRNRSEKIF